MLNKLKAIIPKSIKYKLLKIWHILKPPKIKLTKLIDSGSLFVVASKMEYYRIANYGDEFEIIHKVLAQVKKGDIFFDIGSCLGLYAIHAGMLGSNVYAFEPDPGNRKRLKKNIRLNKLRKNITVLDWAVTDHTGSVDLFTDGINGNSPSLKEVGARGSVTVKANSIDNAVELREIPSPDLIKIDVEGAEILVIKGMQKVLASENAPRLLFIEFHPKFLDNFNSTVEECNSILESHNYNQEFCTSRSDQMHSFYKKVAN